MEDFHQAVDHCMEDVEEQAQVMAMGIDVLKIWATNVEREVKDLDSSIDNVQIHLDKAEDQVDRFVSQNHWILQSLSSRLHYLTLQLKKIEEEFHPQIERWWGRFEKANNVNDRNMIHLEELEKVMGLVGDKIDRLKREFSNNFLEAMEFEETHQTALEVKVASLKERLEHTLTQAANLATFLLSIQH